MLSVVGPLPVELYKEGARYGDFFDEVSF